MKTQSESMPTARRLGRSLSRSCGKALVLGLLLPAGAWAFPPAPDHVIYGMVRDEMGDPLMVANAKVVLQTAAGVQLTTSVVPNMGPGMNYRLQIPMDCGISSDLYKPTALWPAVSFRLAVTVGTVTNLPLELKGNFSSLGKPSETTHLDLTLGADSDGDGIPDAWEYNVIDMLGDGRSLADIRPEDDADGDGLTNLQEYLAGTYAFDAQDGVVLAINGLREGRAQLEFLAVIGRRYTLKASTDLKTWTPVTFLLADAAAGTTAQSAYYATDVRILRVEANAPQSAGPAAAVTFKLFVQ